MNLEWQQVLTQIVGFILLYWVLKKYAWKPLLGMLEERRQKIADEFEKIENTQAEVAKLKEDFDNQIKKIEQIARDKETAAIAEGQRISQEIQVKAREEAKEIIQKAKENINLEISKAKVELRNQIVTLTILATEKIIKEQLDDQKHREKINSFIDEVGSLR